MSTTSQPPRLLIPTLSRTRARTLGLGLVLGLPVVLAFSGCASTTQLGQRASSKMKTFLAIGDKPMPVVGGEPGSSVVASAPDPAPRPSRGRPDGRISGRVFDANGTPVPDARVRLAVGGAAGGKMIRTSTDRSGAFTLRGLVPGASYTLIAEWEGDDGTETGRAVARADDTGVKISLGAAAAPAAGETTSAQAPNRVDRVSEREPIDDEPATPGGIQAGAPTKPEPEAEPASSPVNEEDLPPAPEAEALRTEPRGDAQRATASDARWHRGEAVRQARNETANNVGEPADETNPPRTRRGTPRPVDVAPQSPDDDGPNPLPPALEPGAAGSLGFDRVPATDPGPAPAPTAVESDPFASSPPRLASSGLDGEGRMSANRSRPASPFDSPSKPTAPPLTPRLPADEETPPGSIVASPETFAPVVLSEDPFRPTAPSMERPAAEPPASRTTPKPTRAPARRAVPALPAPVDDSASSDLPPVAEPPAEGLASNDLPPPVEADPTTDAPNPNPEPGPAPASPAEPVASEPRRPTWGEVAAKAGPPPLDEGARIASAPRAADAMKVVEMVPPRPRSETSASSRLGLNRQAPARAADPAVTASCDYDDRQRRVIDFRLPDLDGKPVRFKDLDADLVLLDFWGTWCPPCVKSIPHLVDLQGRSVGKSLVVVGIACEKDAPALASKRVAATAERLGVNYPVLMSRNDGSCPLQEALHIQAFPTMVLLDRQGRVLWRDQGATPATLARLDRMIAASAKSETVRR